MSRWLAERAAWQSEALVAGLLYRVSWYPALVYGAGQVRGDIYRVPQSLLQALDAYEAIQHAPEDEYRREYGRVISVDAGIDAGVEVYEAWLYRYVQSVQGMALLPEGDWLLHLKAD